MANKKTKSLTDGREYWTVFENRELVGATYDRPHAMPWCGSVWNDPNRVGRVLLIDKDDSDHSLDIPHVKSSQYLLFDSREEALAEWVKQEKSELDDIKSECDARLLRLQKIVAGMK